MVDQLPGSMAKLAAPGALTGVFARVSGAPLALGALVPAGCAPAHLAGDPLNSLLTSHPLRTCVGALACWPRRLKLPPRSRIRTLVGAVPRLVTLSVVLRVWPSVWNDSIWPGVTEMSAAARSKSARTAPSAGTVSVFVWDWYCRLSAVKSSSGPVRWENSQ